MKIAKTPILDRFRIEGQDRLAKEIYAKDSTPYYLDHESCSPEEFKTRIDQLTTMAEAELFNEFGADFIPGSIKLKVEVSSYGSMSISFKGFSYEDIIESDVRKEEAREELTRISLVHPGLIQEFVKKEM